MSKAVSSSTTMHLLPTLPTADSALSALSAFAPAAVADAPHGEVSDRYTFVDTKPLVRAAYDQGLQLVSCDQRVVRKGVKSFDNDSAVHLLRFRPAGAPSLRENTPELVIRNGHGAQASLQLHAGIFRLACANGLIIPAATGSAESRIIRHVGDISLDSTIQAFGEVVENAEAFADRAAALGEVTLEDPKQLTRLVRAGVKARWGKWEDVPESDKRVARDFLVPHRYNDRGQDAWTLLNVVQENLVRGTRLRRSKGGQWCRKIRPCNDLDVQTKISKALITEAVVLAN